MSAQTLLESLQRQRATLVLEDGCPVVRAPRGVLTVPLKEELEAHREALTALLRQAFGRVEAGGEQAAPRPDVSGGAAQRVDVDVVRQPEGLARFAEAAEQAGTLALAVTYADASVDPMLTRPSHVQIALPDGTAAIVDLDAAGGLGPLAPVLSKCSVLGHDLQPILVTLAARFEVRPREAWDVLTAARVLEGGLNRDDARRFTLRGMAEMYLKAGALPSLSEPVSEGAPPSTQALVARVTSLFPLRAALAKRLEVEALDNIAVLEFACIPAVAEMALRGVGVDAEAWHGLVVRREAEREELSATLRNELG